MESEEKSLIAPEVSVIIPAFEEAESLKELYVKLVEELSRLGLSRELIFIDDGSTDSTPSVLSEIRGKDPSVRVFAFRRNLGKSAALSLGFKESKGNVVITIDADLQDDPAEIGKLIRKLEEGYDLVSGWKRKRMDPVGKTVPSRVFNFVTSKLTGIHIHDFNCGLKAYRAEVVKVLDVYGELHRYIPVLAHWEGFRVGEEVVKHHPRKYGVSKFGRSRFLNGFLDLLSVMFLRKSERSPLHLFGRIGIFFFAVGFVINLYFGIEWLKGEPLRVRPLLLFGVGLIILAIQFISLGLLGEMIARLGLKMTYSSREKKEG